VGQRKYGAIVSEATESILGVQAVKDNDEENTFYRRQMGSLPGVLQGDVRLI